MNPKSKAALTLVIVLGCAGAPPGESKGKSCPAQDGIAETAAIEESKEFHDVAPSRRLPPALGPDDSGAISLVAVGDISLGRVINAEMVERNDFTFPFAHVEKFIRTADIAVGNLESQLFRGCPLLRGGLRLCASHRAVAGLVKAGFDVVSVANNHAGNFGRRALASSVALLRAKGISVAGYDRPPIIERKNTRFGFLAYDSTQESIPLRRIYREIAAVRARSDVVILMMHWGKEYETTPISHQTDLAGFASSHGVDVIIGAHPHVVQPLTTINQVPVAYSLGNFVFDQMWSEETQNASAAVFKFKDGKVADAELVRVKLVAPGIPTLP